MQMPVTGALAQTGALLIPIRRTHLRPRGQTSPASTRHASPASILYTP